MKELLLYPRGGIWYAEDLENGKPDQEVAGVFDGETWLPTSLPRHPSGPGCSCGAGQVEPWESGQNIRDLAALHHRLNL